MSSIVSASAGKNMLGGLGGHSPPHYDCATEAQSGEETAPPDGGRQRNNNKPGAHWRAASILPGVQKTFQCRPTPAGAPRRLTNRYTITAQNGNQAATPDNLRACGGFGCHTACSMLENRLKSAPNPCFMHVRNQHCQHAHVQKLLAVCFFDKKNICSFCLVLNTKILFYILLLTYQYYHKQNNKMMT